MPSPFSFTDGVDRAALERVVAPVVRAHGAEIVDLELRREQHGWVLRIYVEKAGAAEGRLSIRDASVDLELCANVSRDLSPALDVADLIPHTYSLEVSSPGIERPLRLARDFVRFAGQKARLKLREAIGGHRIVVGTLDGATEQAVRVLFDGRALDVPLACVESARLVFEFGSSGRDRKRH